MIYIHENLSLPDDAASHLNEMVSAPFEFITGAIPAAEISGQSWEQLRHELKVAAGTYVAAVAEATERFQRWQRH